VVSDFLFDPQIEQPRRPRRFNAVVRETIAVARQVRTPYVVVLNAAPPKRQEIEASSVTLARRWLTQMEVPVWSGQITHRASFSLLVTEAESMTDTIQTPPRPPKLAACGGRSKNPSGLSAAHVKKPQCIVTRFSLQPRSAFAARC
jgi:hypothetical protein